MKVHASFLFPAVLWVTTCAWAWAQTDTTQHGNNRDLFELSLEELMNETVSVSNLKATNRREAAGIISVVTAEEIRRAGCRDLTDVLFLVPGFSPALDVTDGISFGVRGIWGCEGKILFLWDGQELNERQYGTVYSGNTLPVDLIERVEVIRGPGSVVYGGFAGLAVVNIISKSAAHQTGAELGATYGHLVPGPTGRWNGYGLLAVRRNDLELTVKATGGRSIRSARQYTDILGESIRLDTANSQTPLLAQVQLRYRNLRAQVFYWQPNQRFEDGFYGVSGYNAYYDNRLLTLDASYDWAVTSKIRLVPRLNAKWSEPFQTVYLRETGEAPSYPHVQRHTASLMGFYELKPHWQWLFGLEYALDYGQYQTGTDSSEFYITSEGQASRTLAFQNGAALLQTTLNGNWGELTIGGRLDAHSLYGLVPNPRLAFTKAWQRLHVKVLGASAFRSPAFQHISLARGLNAEIRPERIWTAECEVGYRLTTNLWASANVFALYLTDPIVYVVQENDAEGYFNGDRMGSLGAELEVRWQPRWGQFQVGYANYVGYAQQVPTFNVPDRPGRYMGLPQHQITARGSVRLRNRLQAHTQCTFVGVRSAVTGLNPTDDTYVVTSLNAQVLWNLGLTLTDWPRTGIDVQLTGHNLLGTRYVHVQAYDGGHLPLPAFDRELTLRVSIRLGQHAGVFNRQATSGSN